MITAENALKKHLGYLSENILILTNKPTTIKERMKNTLPRPRNVVSPEFIEVRNRVTELIKWW